MEKMIYHIISESEWDAVKGLSAYKAESLDHEGFIHFSFGRQVCDTAKRYYANRDDLLVMQVETAKLASELKVDPVPGGDAFPHLYGELNLNAVVNLLRLELQPNGEYQMKQVNA